MTDQMYQPLMFIAGLVVSGVGGTAYLHIAFATKEYVKEVKTDLKEDLDRIEKKIDRLLEKV